MDTINFKKYAILLLFISLFSCEKLFEDGDKRTYFKTEGVGYVYNEHTKEPVLGAILLVTNILEHSNGSVHERFKANTQGYFRIKFLKRFHNSNVTIYSFTTYDGDFKLNNHPQRRWIL